MKTPEEKAAAFAKKKRDAYMKEYREKNRERIRAQNRAYYLKHRREKHGERETTETGSAL